MTKDLNAAMENDPRIQLNAGRAEITARLRAARAQLSPQAAVTAAHASGDHAEAAELGRQIAADKAAPLSPGSFQPRSLTMRLILERPDLFARMALALATLALGSRRAARLGSGIAIIAAAWPLLRPVFAAIRFEPGLAAVVRDEAES